MESASLQTATGEYALA